jgi:hypothetical protein
MGLFLITLIIALPFAYLFLFKTTYWVKERGEWINKGRYKLKLWQWLVAIITLLFPLLNCVSYFVFVVMLLAEAFDEYDEKLTLCEGLKEKLNKRY